MALSVTNMLTDFTQRSTAAIAVGPLNGSEPLLEVLVADLRYADHGVLMLAVIRMQALVPVVHGPLLLVFMGQYPLQLLFCHALSHYIALVYGIPTRVIVLDVDLRHAPISIDHCVQHRPGVVLGATRRGLRVVAPPQVSDSPASPPELGGTEPQPQPNEAQHLVASEHHSSADATSTSDRTHTEPLPKAVEEREAVCRLHGGAEATFEKNTLLHYLRPFRVGPPPITVILAVIIVLVGVNTPSSSQRSSSLHTDPGALYLFWPTCPAGSHMCSWYDHQPGANLEAKAWSKQVLLSFSETIAPYLRLPPATTKRVRDFLSTTAEKAKIERQEIHGYFFTSAVERQERHSHTGTDEFLRGFVPKQFDGAPSHQHGLSKSTP